MSWGEVKYLQKTREASLTGEGATVYESLPEMQISPKYTTLAKFIAPVTGLYKITGTVTSIYTGSALFRVGKPIENSVTFNASEGSTTYHNNVPELYQGLVIGGTFSLSKTINTSILSTTEVTELTRNSCIIYSEHFQTGVSDNIERLFYCYAGERVILWAGSGTTNQFKVSDLKIDYQPREV